MSRRERTNDGAANPQERARRIEDVILDVLQRRELGEQVSDEIVIAEYSELMPELGEELKLAIELARGVVAEPVADTNVDQHAPNGSSALKIRCPYCHQTVEVVSDTSFTDITCSGCGSHFSLAGGSTETKAPRTFKNLGHFELVGRIGMGSFGTVWKARDTELDRSVAIKIPRQSKLAPEEVEQFLREARAAAQLNHPHIVSVYEVGRDEDTVFIVSDFVRGLSLADWRAGQQPTFREAATLCTKVADALHHAHEAGVVHRDLKPHNIMIDGDGEPHLMDFGLARRDVGEITMTLDGHVLGTPAYMSPEQARGEAHRADRRTDVYSLGVILFELLTGELPFRGNARMLVHQVLNEEAPSPRKLNGNVPKDLETICQKCLEKEPDKRYTCAGALARELRRFSSGEPIQARPISAVARAWRWCKRNKGVAASLSAIALLLIAATVVSSVAASHFRRLEQDQRTLAETSARLADEKELKQYVSDIDLAHRILNEGNLARAEELLLKYVPETIVSRDVRSFEWDLLWRLCQGNAILSLPQQHEVQSLAISKTGRWIATTSIRGYEGTLRTLDAQLVSGELILYSTEPPQQPIILRQGQNPASCAAFTPDGESLITGHLDGSLHLWTGDGFGEQRRLSAVHENAVTAIAFSPLSSGFATADEGGQIIWWNYPDIGEEKRWDDLDFEIRSLAFAADGRHLAVGGRTVRVELINMDDGTRGDIRGLRRGYLTTLAFSPTENNLLAIGTRDASVIVVDTTIKQVVLVGKHRDAVSSVAFLPDGKTLLSASWDRTIRLWEHKSAKQLGILKGHRNVVCGMVPTPDGNQIYSVSSDKSCKVWRAATPSASDVLQLGDDPWARGADFSADGKWLASGNWDGTIRLWDVGSGSIIDTDLVFPDHKSVMGIRFHPQREFVAIGNGAGEIAIWDPRERQTKKTFQAHDETIFRLACSPDGRYLVSATGNWPPSPIGEVKVWNCQALESEQTSVQAEYTFIAHQAGVSTLTFTPNGQTLVTGGVDGSVSLWEFQVAPLKISRKQDVPGHGNMVLSSAVSKDGRLLATGSEHFVVLWDLISKVEIAKFPQQSTADSLVFTPDSRTLIAGYGNGSIKLWNVETRREMITLEDHTGFLQETTMSPDGKILASASADGTVRLWRGTRP